MRCAAIARHDAQARIGDGRRRAPLQLRRDAGKVAAAQVAAQHLQRQRRQRRAQRDAGDAADRAEQHCFGQHQRAPLARRQAQHAEQRELLRAARHAQRQHREHQEAAGEQRDQRQHSEVDAVGARQVAHALGRVPGLGCGDAGRQPQAAQPGFTVGAGRQPHVDAGQHAEAAEQLLCRGDVHHGQRRATGDHAAADRGLAQLQSALQLHRGAGHEPLRRRIEEHRGRRQQRQPVGAGRWLRHQRRRHGGDHQRVDAHHPDRQPAAVRERQQRAQFQHRAGNGDGGIARDPAEQAFVERPLRRAQLQVRLAVHRADRAGELAQGGRVDELNGEGEPDPQQHRDHGGGGAPRVVSQLLPGESAQQGKHQAIVGPAQQIGAGHWL
jgi:hypothetical protein